MATYFWVGGSGTWDSANTANWSASSGGAGGSGPPIVGDTVNFDALSGSGTCTTAANAAASNVIVNTSTLALKLGANLTIATRLTLTAGTVDLNNFSFTMNNFSSSNSNVRTVAFGTGSINLTGNGATIWTLNTGTNLSVTGTPTVNLTYSGSTGTRTVSSFTATEAAAFSFVVTAGTDTFRIDGRAKNLDLTNFAGTYNGASAVIAYGNVVFGSGTSILAGAGPLFFGATSGTQNLTTNGKVLDFPITQSSPGATLVIQDNLEIGATRTLTLTNGTLNANDKNVTLGSFALGSGTKTLTLGSGTWTIASSGTAWNANTNVANLTVSPSAGIISMTSASAKTFAGGAKAWPRLNQGGAGALTIQQSNSFANITNTVQPATITLTSGTTQTVGALSVSGTSGNLVTLNSSTADSRATLVDRSGVNDVSFVSIKDINAVGGSLWYAPKIAGNVDAGNNYGWNFSRALKRVFSTVFKPTFRPIFS
jgi:hypothetical protein